MRKFHLVGGSPQQGPGVGDGMIGRSPAMTTLFKQIERVAPTDATVLIRGETGTGKELVARAIHRRSDRQDRPVICVNCAAIPETLIESELFGYEKGAFTGAAANRIGLVEAADGGTLFLDEIGELPLEAQARLLRVLQEGEIRAIGSVHARRVDVRLLAATHRDLRQLCSHNRFRPDLYYRINVVQLRLPPLRERGDDILELAEAILAATLQRLGLAPRRLADDAIAALYEYEWPGNVRELENAIERAVILGDGETVSADLLDLELPLDAPARAKRPPAPPPTAPQNPTGEELTLEEYFMRFVLRHQDQMSETELARKLGVSRKCLWERRQRLGIPRPRQSEGD
jgi:DNA-binding NtrC family response regulator